MRRIITKRVYEAKFQRKNKRGRPKRLWTQAIKEDAKRRGKIWNSMKYVVQNKEIWGEMEKRKMHS